MKPEKLHDAMNFIDDELIEAADKLRQSPKSTRIKTTRILALAAAVLVVFTGVLVFARYSNFDVTVDSAANADSTDMSDKTDDGAHTNATDGIPPYDVGGDLKEKTGADVLYGVYGFDKGYSTVSLSFTSGDATPTKQYHEVIDSLIEVISTSPVISPGAEELDDKLIAILTIGDKDDTKELSEIPIQLYKNGYVHIPAIGSKDVWVKLDEAVFNDYLSQLGYTDFNPASFAEGIPTPTNECFAFYHKIFPTSVFLYFYTDAHYWPDGYSPDQSSLKAYTYNPKNSANGIGTVTFPLPEDFDLSYDSVTPIYANGGGGSSECMVVFRFDYGLESVFVEFNNFAWTNDILEFEYAGILEEEAVKAALVDAQSKLDSQAYYEGGQK